MDRRLNTEILRLSLPGILANITIPLVGMVDTAIAGHLENSGPETDSASVLIGAIALGSTIFNLLYWNVGFLRTGVGGLTAQAFGQKDRDEVIRIFARAEVIALAAAAVILLLQWPIARIATVAFHGTGAVEDRMLEYFYIRVWAAPATISLMAFSGWFIGMQDSMSSMWKDLTVNGVNIVCSFLLAFGAGMGFRGIVWGTVIAQYSGLLFCVLTVCFKYGKTFAVLRRMTLAELFRGREVRRFFHMNIDLEGRSIGFCVIYLGYTYIATQYGDTMLACSSILMQLLMIFSYFTDGFAYAGEALTGRFIGERNPLLLRKSILYILFWGMLVSVVFVGIYAAFGETILQWLTSDATLIESCMSFRLWMILMPLLGMLPFLFDGFFLGATATASVRNAMLGSMVCFLLVWETCRLLFHPEGTMAIHCLMTAYYSHLLFRAVYLFFRRKALSIPSAKSGMVSR